MSTKRRVVCLTGTRADYPRISPVLRELRENFEGDIEIHLGVTGQHLIAGTTGCRDLVVRDGFGEITEFPMYEEEYDGTPFGMASAVAKCLSGTAKFLRDLNPNLVLVTVDRIETIAFATAASIMNMPIAHVQGGELTGTIDENIRHAVTKLSHYHFPANSAAADIIAQMGEQRSAIFTYGCPYVDFLIGAPILSLAELQQRFSKTIDGTTLCIFHPDTVSYDSMKSQAESFFDVIREFDRDSITIIRGNNDAGSGYFHDKVLASGYKVFDNLEPLTFVNLMRHASMIIGNSSVGIREAPYFRLPAVNVGTRQRGRQRARNVIDVECNYYAICDGIAEARALNLNYLSDEELFIYGHPGSSSKIARKILDLAHTPHNLAKKFKEYN